MASLDEATQWEKHGFILATSERNRLGQLRKCL
jgi:hypothetical protein